jgi:S1-C subfamily serine protease
MAGDSKDLLLQFSAALVSATASAQSSVVAIRAPRSPPLSGTLWRNNLVVASEQVFPRADAAEIVQTDGAAIRARVAGRDPGTNIVALQLESPIEFDRPEPADPALGALVLTFAADARGAPLVRLGIVRSLGPAWHSRGGGRIDRRITLDLHLSSGEEGGPVLDPAGALLGMSTAGPCGRALVIPASTIDRILPPLIQTGRVARGWLGAALYPVALSDAVSQQIGQDRGLMVLRVAEGGPAAAAGVIAGDILVAIGGTVVGRPSRIAQSFGPESVGQQLELSLLRAGTRLTLNATIAARPSR